MNWRRSLVRPLARQLSARDLAAIAGEILPEILNRLPRAERIAFLCEMAEVVVGPALRDLGREERARLMNELLPLVAREFPLSDLDLLAAFSEPASSQPAAGV